MDKESRAIIPTNINPDTGEETDPHNWTTPHVAPFTRHNPAVSMPLAVVVDDRNDVWDNMGKSSLLQVRCKPVLFMFGVYSCIPYLVL